MFLLAKRWNESINPTGYLISEKLDGFRCHWNSKQLISRGRNGQLGNVISCPSWFTADLPNEALDGEIWAGRGQRDKVASAVKGSRERDWVDVIYSVFDVPNYNQPFERRIDRAKLLLKKSKHGIVIPFWMCCGKGHLLDQLDQVVGSGGEGLMLRKPWSMYEHKRSDTLLKVKKRYDAEAVVIGHVEGTRPGLCGSLRVVTKDGKEFKVGSGMTEAMAHNPPKIGTIITYEWESLTKDDIPNPAFFLRIWER
jgi:DNA ligase-1